MPWFFEIIFKDRNLSMNQNMILVWIYFLTECMRKILLSELNWCSLNCFVVEKLSTLWIEELALFLIQGRQLFYFQWEWFFHWLQMWKKTSVIMHILSIFDIFYILICLWLNSYILFNFNFQHCWDTNFNKIRFQAVIFKW